MIEVLKKLTTDERTVLELCRNSLETNKGLLVTYFNQHCFNVCWEDDEYRKLLSQKARVYIDGIGIYGSLKFLGKKEIQNFNASDLNERIFSHFIHEKKKLFIVGGNFDLNFVKNFSSKKGIALAGYNDGYFSDGEWETVVNNISRSKPDVVVLGMGVPRQEKFGVFLQERYDFPLILCVGNFLEFYFGTKKRVPEMFRNKGFEWLFRFFTEPKRLAKRYFIGIPVFFMRIIKIKFQRKNLFTNDK